MWGSWLAFIVIVSGIVLLAMTVATVVHECGHAFVALIVGNEVRSVTIGRLGPSRTIAVGSIRIVLHLLPVDGMVCHVPRSRGQDIAIFSAGPVANLALGGACLLVMPSQGVGALIVAVFAGVNFLSAVLSLIPMPAQPPKKLATDGWQLGGLLFGTKEGRASRRARWTSNRAGVLAQWGSGIDLTIDLNPRAGEQAPPNPEARPTVQRNSLDLPNNDDPLEGLILPDRTINSNDGEVSDTTE